MKKTIYIKQFFLVVVLASIPTLLNILAAKDAPWEYLITHHLFSITAENKEQLQFICLIISFFFTAMFLAFKLAVSNIQKERLEEQRNQFIRFNKNIFVEELKRFSTNFSDLNIRLFVPKHKHFYTFLDKFSIKHKVIFSIINIPDLAEQQNTKGFEFEVHPNPKGLVGQCYEEKCLIYDDDETKINSQTKYHLSKFQTTRTSHIKWCLCFPILDSKDNVEAIIAFDGNKKVTIKKHEDDLLNFFSDFALELHNGIPQLFKR